MAEHLRTNNPEDAYFVKHGSTDKNMIAFIQYCNRLRPQVNYEKGEMIVVVFMEDPNEHEKQYLRNIHKIHWLYEALDLENENTKQRIEELTHDNTKMRHRYMPRGIFTCHHRHAFALEPLERVDLSKEVEKLKRELQEIKDAILYAPGGPIYQESKAHFNSTILSQQQEQQDPAASYPLPKKNKHT